MLSFLGALAGAGAAAWVALRGQHQDARGEWRLRLDRAIDLVTAPTQVEQQIGDELLADLIESDLGSEEDRGLARRIARIRLGQQLGAATPGAHPVDLALLPGDNGRCRRGGGPMTATSQPEGILRLPSSTVRLARALVRDAQRRGTRENSRVEDAARTPLPDDSAR